VKKGRAGPTEENGKKRGGGNHFRGREKNDNRKKRVRCDFKGLNGLAG